MRKSSVYMLAAGAALLATAIGRLGNSRSLAGKVALLTGGSRGLGLQLARELANEGCKLILVARSEEELTTAERELHDRGADVRIIISDLTQPDQVERMLRTALSFHARIHIVVNDAGRIDVGPIDSFTEKDFQASMDLMFWAPLRIIFYLLPDLLKSGDADIVNISSIGGKVPVPHLLPYSSAKFALRGFSEGLDAEVRSRGVHVLTVTPGLMRTGGHTKARFRGKAEDEYKWFAVGATLPGIAMEVGRAARQIVSALKRRQRSLTLTWSAEIAGRLYGALPNPSLALLNLINDFLPEPIKDQTDVPGSVLRANEPTILRTVTQAGEKAIETQNQNLMT
jgi:short-subunit dehydrogenase